MIATWLSFSLISAYDCSGARCVAPLSSVRRDCVPRDLNPNVSEGGLEPFAYAQVLLAEFAIEGRVMTDGGRHVDQADDD